MEPGFKEGYKVVRRVGATDRAGFKPATLEALQSVRYRMDKYTVQTDYDSAGPFAVFDRFALANRFASDLILWRLNESNHHYAILRVEYQPSQTRRLWHMTNGRYSLVGWGMKTVGRLMIRFKNWPRGTKFARVVIPREVLEVKEND